MLRVLIVEMDRWSDDVSTPSASRAPNFSAASKDLSSFVNPQGAQGPTGGPAQPLAVIIQPSKRAQAAEQAARQVASRLAALEGPAPGSKLPAWATQSPPPGFYLEVVKEGAVLLEVPLTGPATLLGRSPAADLLLDHASISRQHAALCWHPTSSTMVFLDLGSVHGSWVDGQPARSGNPVQLRPGSEFRLGASTRHFFLRRHAGQEDPGPSQQPQQTQQQQVQPVQQEARPVGEAATGAKRQGGGEEAQAQKKRLRFADEGRDGGLEQTIGYSSRGGFNLVGPRPVKGTTEGRFGDLVQSTTLAERRPGQQVGTGGEEGSSGGGSTPRAGGQGSTGGRVGIGHPAAASRVGVRSAMELFNQKVLQGRQQGGAGQGQGALFGDLPPPAKT